MQVKYLDTFSKFFTTICTSAGRLYALAFSTRHCFAYIRPNRAEAVTVTQVFLKEISGARFILQITYNMNGSFSHIDSHTKKN